MFLLPRQFTVEAYQLVMKNAFIWTSYANSIYCAFFTTALGILLTSMLAYGLSKKSLAGNKFLSFAVVFCMIFNGGLIPTYLVVKQLGLLDTMWAVILPGAAGAWAILVGRAFFKQTVPEELNEAAKVDGAGDFQVFLRIAIPLSAPIIATLALFHGVGLWNEYFNALIYLSDRDAYPLQLILRELLVVSQDATQGGGAGDAGSSESLAEQLRLASLIKYAVMIVASFPLLVIYPFLQRFFTQGVLIGSVK